MIYNNAEKALEAAKKVKVENAENAFSNTVKEITEQREKYILDNPQYAATMMPFNAKGTNYWRGGPTWVNEEGGEIMNLPRGTQIIPHDVSMEMARAAGRASVTNNNSTTNNAYNYGAQQQVNVFSISGKVIAREIIPNVSVRLSDDIYRRRRSGGN